MKHSVCLPGEVKSRGREREGSLIKFAVLAVSSLVRLLEKYFVRMVSCGPVVNVHNNPTERHQRRVPFISPLLVDLTHHTFSTPHPVLLPLKRKIFAPPSSGVVGATPTLATSAFNLNVAGGASGGGNASGTGRPVFHEHIMQALGSLRQRNERVFASAVGHARALALARLGSGGGGQEGGKGLYPCLVQLQCLVEMEEAFAVLSSRDGLAGDACAAGVEGDGVDDAVSVRSFCLLVFNRECVIVVFSSDFS